MANKVLLREDLGVLTCPMLQKLCVWEGVPISGRKDELIQRLMTCKVTYGQLRVAHLKYICNKLDLPDSGNRDTLTRVLTQPRKPAADDSDGSDWSEGSSEHDEDELLPYLNPEFQAVRLANWKEPAITEDHYMGMSAATLRNLCREWNVKASGSKQQMVAALMDTRRIPALQGKPLAYCDLNVFALQEMCKGAGLSVGGGRKGMTSRLVAAMGGQGSSKAAAGGDKKKASKAPPKKKAKLSPNAGAGSAVVPGTRVALCIGISKYQVGELKNAAKDARDLGAALKARGVDVTVLQDPNLAQIRDAVDDFCMHKINSKTELAVFHYAGHGTFSLANESAHAGKHIMMASCWKDYNVKQGGFAWSANKHGYPVEDVVERMESRGNQRNLVLIDACRSPSRGTRNSQAEDAASRAWGERKLTGKAATLVCNACRRLQVALDGVAGRNGLYTESLLKHLFDPSHSSIYRAINHVNVEVYQKSKEAQQPVLGDVFTTLPFEDIKL